MLICVMSCQNNKTTFQTDNKRCFQILNINKTEKPKVFFSLDPECPLCKSYSKTMNKFSIWKQF